MSSFSVTPLPPAQYGAPPNPNQPAYGWPGNNPYSLGAPELTRQPGMAQQLVPAGTPGAPPKYKSGGRYKSKRYGKSKRRGKSKRTQRRRYK